MKIITIDFWAMFCLVVSVVVLWKIQPGQRLLPTREGGGEVPAGVPLEDGAFAPQRLGEQAGALPGGVSHRPHDGGAALLLLFTEGEVDPLGWLRGMFL